MSLNMIQLNYDVSHHCHPLKQTIEFLSNLYCIQVSYIILFLVFCFLHSKNTLHFHAKYQISPTRKNSAFTAFAFSVSAKPETLSFYFRSMTLPCVLGFRLQDLILSFSVSAKPETLSFYFRSMTLPSVLGFRLQDLIPV